ncbi:MAG: HAD-IA family hydrolase [Fimbriimonadaceae bacterium]|nr:HAD-IA family hydrolase [Fimbriimonadaceae bacterium]
MPITCITFDCADTLVRADWNSSRFAIESARMAGMNPDEQVAKEVYERLLFGRWKEYGQLNLTKDPDICDGFWIELTRDWMAKVGLPADKLDPLMEIVRERLYGPDQQIFSLFDDTLACLDKLSAKGIRLAIISNWDYSLHRVVKNLNIQHYFEKVYASLEVGVEKPESYIFTNALQELGVKPDETLHIGDNPLDDVQGARGVGMHAALIDRSCQSSYKGTLSTLHDIEQVFTWID